MFLLDARIDSGSVFICDLDLCQLRLMDDCRYPWLLLIPRRAGVAELFDLTTEDQSALMREITKVSSALKQLTSCTKINVATLGNKVPQLHVHVIARNSGDTAWPGAVWDKGEAVRHDGEARNRLVAALKDLCA
jgi:diadenosine tetraphosphate (Ap4A) HIT family hydrolase